MHFSSPSGQRLSWCRPWNRGAVGFFSKGYCSVTTFLNMVRNVTPKPATGSQNCSFREGICSRFPRVLTDGHGRDGVAAGEGVERLGTGIHGVRVPVATGAVGSVGSVGSVG